MLEGYAGVTEVYLDLWMAGDQTAARPARQARAALRRFAERSSRPGRAHGCMRAWPPTTLAEATRCGGVDKSLKTAERLAMPYEQGRAHYELTAPAARPSSRQAHLRRACEIFADIGASIRTNAPTPCR